jgi:SARP family transcriptional regulator, regulator of embCAB operon
VSSDVLAVELWGDNVPANAWSTLQTYVLKLRRVLGFDVSGGVPDIVVRPPSYELRIRPDEIDLIRFRALVQRGREELDRDRASAAAGAFRHALALWRGPALADVVMSPVLNAYRTRFDEERLEATELRIETDLVLGRHRELIGELKSLTVQHRYNERLHALLITALLRAGRRHEAIEAYGHLRQMLHEDLGLQPQFHIEQLAGEYDNGADR